MTCPRNSAFVRYGLKGHSIIARPNGLGAKAPPVALALNGQYSQLHVALVERCDTKTHSALHLLTKNFTFTRPRGIIPGRRQVIPTRREN